MIVHVVIVGWRKREISSAYSSVSQSINQSVDHVSEMAGHSSPVRCFYLQCTQSCRPTIAARRDRATCILRFLSLHSGSANLRSSSHIFLDICYSSLPPLLCIRKITRIGSYLLELARANFHGLSLVLFPRMWMRNILRTGTYDYDSSLCSKSEFHLTYVPAVPLLVFTLWTTTNETATET